MSKKITGTYHSRVTQVSHGTGHIGTTLDPNYIGPSLIAVHNHSNVKIELIPEQTAFVTLVFQYLSSESSKDQHGNKHGRTEILGEVGIILSTEEKNALDKPYMSDRELLFSKLEECEHYKAIKQSRQGKVKKSWMRMLYIGLPIITISLIIASTILFVNKTKLERNHWYTPTTYATEKSLEAIVVAFISLMTNKLLNQDK